jgi:hypothetical protein
MAAFTPTGRAAAVREVTIGLFVPCYIDQLYLRDG